MPNEAKTVYPQNQGSGIKGYFCCLSIEDLPSMQELEALVIRKMENKEFYFSGGFEYYVKLFQGAGKIIGFRSEYGKLVAFCALVTSDEAEQKIYASDGGIQGEGWSQVCILDSIMVAPNFRGNGLQIDLLKLAIQYAEDGGRWNYMLSTVHPDNHFSLNNFEKSGFQVYKKIIKHGKVPRYVMGKAIENI